MKALNVIKSPVVQGVVMLLFLVGEAFCKVVGFEVGPLFTILNVVFTSLGLKPDQALTLGFDPTLIATGLASLYLAYANWKASKKAKESKDPA